MDRFFLKSVRFKIIVLCLLTLVSLFLIFCISIQRRFTNSLYEKIDALILLKAEGIENSIRTYWQTQNMDVTRDWFTSNVFSGEKDIKFERIADYLANDKIRDELEITGMHVDIVDPTGELIASSREFPEVSFLRKKLMARPLQNTRFDDLNITINEGKKVPVRILTKLIRNQSQVKCIVQVIASLSPVITEIHRLKKVFFTFLPIAVLIAGITAYSLVKVTLKPIDEMVKTIREIKSNNLTLRLPVSPSSDEISRLAHTFNETLERLEKSFMSQQQMLQDISHELRTPLTIIKGQLQLALSKPRSPEQYKNVLFSNLEEVEKIKRIIDEIMALAQLETQKFVDEMESIQLGDLIRSIIEDIHPLAKSKEVQLSFTDSAKLILKGNPFQLRQLFSNLLENGIKYNHPGGQVTIKVNNGDGRAKVEISDNGIGISPADLPYIFNRFYRADKARQGSYGIGLGLSIAKSIVEAHQGKIEVKSILGQGTTFNIIFPLTQ